MGLGDHITKPLTSSHPFSMEKIMVKSFSWDIPRKASDSLNSCLHKETTSSSSTGDWDFFSHPLNSPWISRSSLQRIPHKFAASGSLWRSWAVARRLRMVLIISFCIFHAVAIAFPMGGDALNRAWLLNADWVQGCLSEMRQARW